jgi:hypothetical protein
MPVAEALPNTYPQPKKLSISELSGIAQTDQIFEQLRLPQEKSPVPSAFEEAFDESTAINAKKRLKEAKGNRQGSQKPVAFDLGVQVHYVQKGMRWHEYRKDIETYLAEMYAKVPFAHYQQSIRYVGGEAQIWFGEGDNQTRAIDSYAVPAIDPSMPEWYRKRAQRDVFGTRTLEKYLASAQIGDSFMDISPAPFDISKQDKEKYGFGSQSFLRVYTLAKDEKGQQILKSYARRLEVDPDTLSRLFSSLTGETISTKELLGTVRSLDRRFDFSRIQKIVTSLETDFTRKTDFSSSEQTKIQDISKHLKILDRWNYGIYLMMKNPLYYRYQSQIQTQFQKMEMAFVDLLKDDLDPQMIEELMNLDPRSFVDQNPRLDGRMAAYIRSRRYQAGFACDAVGSSFGDTAPNALMSYQRMSSDTAGYVDFPKIERRPADYWKEGNCRPDGGCGKENVKVGPCQLCHECEARYTREEKWKKWLSGRLN